jgi:hypothetical protein
MVQDTNSSPVFDQLGVKKNHAFFKNMTVSTLENQGEQIDVLKKSI